MVTFFRPHKTSFERFFRGLTSLKSSLPFIALGPLDAVRSCFHWQWWVLWIIMCSRTSYIRLPGTCLPFANCKLVLFMYAWDFPLKARAFTFNARSNLPLWHTGWKAQVGTWTGLPWWQERGTHFADVSVTKKTHLHFHWMLQIHNPSRPPSVCSPQTSVGAPGWRRPSREWERCNTLPPPGSATCTWKKGPSHQMVAVIN